MTVFERRATSPWLITYGTGNTEDVRLRLFCFHYAGATAAIFRSWPDAVPAGVELVAVQLPGRDYRFAEPLLTDMRQIATGLADVMPPVLDKPYVLFGHSMGALLGFDLIRILRARGLRQPELLIAAGRNAPQFKWRDAGIQALPDDAFVAAVRDYNGTPEALLAEESLRELWLPRLRADLTVSGLYEYVEQPPLDCPIVVMSGEEDRLVSAAGLRGWLTQTTGGVRFFRYPGNHFFLHSAERLVLAKVHAELETQLARHPYSQRRTAMMTPGNDTPADGTPGLPVGQRPAALDLVRIFDTTLRDGEQSPGATLNADEKLVIAEQLARLGVDIIEAGFPASSPGDLSAVQRIAVSVGRAGRTDKHGQPAAPPCIAAMARASRADIDQAWRGVRDARHSRIHIVLATSDLHLEYKLRKTRSEVLDMARRAVSHARQLCEDVEFSPEDATRSDREFLVQVLDAVIEAGATTLNIPDTVGYATPEEYGELISFLRRRVARADSVVWSVHCHDDLGLATANTLAGIVNGGRQIEVSINGIGERAGNACLAEAVMALYTRRPVFNLETNIVRREICRTSKMVSKLTGLLVQPNKAIVGANAFAHEAGIHQDGMLKNKRTYEIMDAEDVGWDESRLVLGKHSGRNALRAKLEKLGYHVSSEAIDQVFKKFKDLVDTQKVISDAQLHTLCAELSRATDARLKARLDAETVQA